MSAIETRPYIHFQQKRLEGSKEPTMVVLQGPATSIVPNNPAGILRILGTVPENVRLGYADLNEGFFLHYMLTGSVLQKVYDDHRDNSVFAKNAEKLGLTDERMREVIASVDGVREGMSQYDTYQAKNFDRFVQYKKVMEDAAKIVSAPFMTDEMAEEVSLHHNMVNYSSAFRNSRERLLELTKKAGLFRDYISHHVLPELLEEGPDVIVISATHPAQIPFSFQFASMAREAGYKGKIIIGGNTVSRRADTWVLDDDYNHKLFREKETDEDCIIDAISIGNGEVPLGILAAELALGRPLDEAFRKMPGLVYKRDGKIVAHKLAIPKTFNAYQVREDVSEFLTPGFMPEGKGVQSVRKRDICVYDQETKGGCKFCAISKASNMRLAPFMKSKNVPLVAPEESLEGEKKYVIFDPNVSQAVYEPIQQQELTTAELVDEIVRGYKAGFPIVNITDEQWLAQDGSELLEELQKRGLNKDPQKPDIVYSAYMRIDDIKDEEAVAKLAQSGLRFAQFGLESTYWEKMASMTKGTTEAKLARFKEQLSMLVRHGIMPHVFVIVGSPVDKRYWEDGKRFAADERGLGRKVTPDDAEVLEAVSNLRYLWEIRDLIFTMKHTQSKLSFGSVDSIFPGIKGLKRRDTRWEEEDLASNVPFQYEKGYEIHDSTIKALLDLYELWRKELLPYQLVTQELMYDQRLLPEFQVEGIKRLAAQKPPGEHRLESQEKTRKREVLDRLWRQLAGKVFLDHRRKLGILTSKGVDDRQTKRLEKLVADETQANLFLREFPNGFRSWEDLYRAADLLELERARLELQRKQKN